MKKSTTSRNDLLNEAFRKGTGKLVKKSPFFKVKVTQQDSSSFGIRLSKSGDIAKKINKENEKLRHNIEQLGSLVGQGSLSTSNLCKVSGVCGNKFQKYRQKIRERQEMVDNMNKDIESFAEWWKKYQEQKEGSQEKVE